MEVLTSTSHACPGPGHEERWYTCHPLCAQPDLCHSVCFPPCNTPLFSSTKFLLVSWRVHMCLSPGFCTYYSSSWVILFPTSPLSLALCEFQVWAKIHLPREILFLLFLIVDQVLCLCATLGNFFLPVLLYLTRCIIITYAGVCFLHDIIKSLRADIYLIFSLIT